MLIAEKSSLFQRIGIFAIVCYVIFSPLQQSEYDTAPHALVVDLSVYKKPNPKILYIMSHYLCLNFRMKNRQVCHFQPFLSKCTALVHTLQSQSRKCINLRSQDDRRHMSMTSSFYYGSLIDWLTSAVFIHIRTSKNTHFGSSLVT